MGVNINDDGELEYTLDAAGGQPVGGSQPAPLELDPLIQDLLSRVGQLEQKMGDYEPHFFPNETETTPGDWVRVALVKTAGSDGNKTAAPSYTYTGTVSGTSYPGLTPLVRSHQTGRFEEASWGLGYLDSGSLVLVAAFEVKRTGGCP